MKGQCFPCDKAQDATEQGAKCGNMGYYADRSTGRGQLYLVTREEEPFCAHQFNIEIFSSENDLPLRTLGKLEAVLEGDGSLNETFSITEKDDTEFFAGDVISRILVPHPALGFPHSITLMYKSYSGWLSKGLPQWTIHKVVLTDSFGTKMSLCKRGTSLSSEKPVYLKLQPGDCYLPEENDVNSGPGADKILELAANEDSSVTKQINKSTKYDHSTVNPYDNEIDKLREKKEIINLGTNFKITKNNSYSYTTKTDQLPWQPVLEKGKIFDRQLNLNEMITIGPILKNSIESESGRSISDGKEIITIVEPILKPTTQKTRKHKQKHVSTTSEPSTSNDVVKPRENSFFTIQLLPFRLGELIERAERYARETLLPLISEQAPRFFGFGGTPVSYNGAGNSGSSSGAEIKSDRQPKYFPSLGEFTAANDADGEETRISERRINLPPPFSTSLQIEPADFGEENDAERSPSTRAPHPSLAAFTAKSVKQQQNSTNNNNKVLTNLPPPVEESRGSKNILSLLRHQPKMLPIDSTGILGFSVNTF